MVYIVRRHHARLCTQSSIAATVPCKLIRFALQSVTASLQSVSQHYLPVDLASGTALANAVSADLRLHHYPEQNAEMCDPLQAVAAAAATGDVAAAANAAVAGGCWQFDEFHHADAVCAEHLATLEMAYQPDPILKCWVLQLLANYVILLV